jgi:Topoisomerase DNA binding C4 zinc finger
VTSAESERIDVRCHFRRFDDVCVRSALPPKATSNFRPEIFQRWFPILNRVRLFHNADVVYHRLRIPRFVPCRIDHYIAPTLTIELVLSASGAAPTCDCCGAPMRLVHWKRRRFWGCTRFPQCRNTERWHASQTSAARHVREPVEVVAQCPHCPKKLRVPAGRFLNVRCPCCNGHFQAQT